MKKIQFKTHKNLIPIAWAIIIILIILLFTMNKTIKSDCEKAVLDYQKLAKNFEVQPKSVTIGSSIVVDYIWRLADWEVFDTSVESVAKACWKYQEWRDYTQWLAFQAWAWQMIAWFDAGVIWMKIWETKTVNIPYMEAYWARDEQRILKMDMTDEFKQYKEWQTISIMTENWPVQLTVYKITKDQITLDTNHSLAGKDLIFDITIKQIQ